MAFTQRVWMQNLKQRGLPLNLEAPTKLIPPISECEACGRLLAAKSDTKGCWIHYAGADGGSIRERTL